MIGSRWRTAVVATTIVASLSLLLTGCVATTGDIIVHAAVASRDALRDKNKPHVGECWQGTYANSDGYANWGSKPAVSCNEPHQLYTFAVRPLHAVHKGKLFTKSGYVVDDVWNDAYDTCSDEEEIDLPELDATSQRLWLEYFLPEEAQWNAGARWVRCDVTVLKIGSSVAHPEYENLDSFTTLTHELESDAHKFDFCVSDPGGTTADGPKGKNAVYADCDGDAQWVLHSYEDLFSGPGGSYPSSAELQNQYQQNCADKYEDAGHVTYPYFPSKSDWKTGDQEFECWLGKK